MDSDVGETIEKEDSIFIGGGETQEDLAEKLTELQVMMIEMKDGFVHAMEELSRIQLDDGQLRQQVDDQRKEQEKQLKELKSIVTEFKEDFSRVTSRIENTSEVQERLQKQVDKLTEQKEPGISEALSPHDSRQRSRNVGQGHDIDHLNGNHVTSDHDSGVATFRHGDFSSHGEATPPLHISPLVKPYLDGLPPVPSQDLYDIYDSDSSLAAAVNKSINLSRSLEDKCLGSKHSDSSDDEGSQENKKSQTRKQKTPTSVHNSAKKLMHSSHKSNAPHEQSFRGSQRTKIVREILDTERRYCSGLWNILDTFIEPIRQLGIVTSKDIETMFPSSVSRLYEHHCKILHKLEERMSNWKYECVVGDVFTRLADTSKSDILGTYRIYVQDFPASVTTISKYSRQSNKFRKMLRKCSQDVNCEGLDLTAYLLTPIQRIPRYVLLLKQLLKYTEEDHPDYYYIEMSLEKLKHFLNTLNSSIEQSMHFVNSDSQPPKSSRKLKSSNSLRSSSSSQEGIEGYRKTKFSYPGLPKVQLNGHESDSSDFMDPSLVPGIPQEKMKLNNKHDKGRKQKVRNHGVDLERSVRAQSSYYASNEFYDYENDHVNPTKKKKHHPKSLMVMEQFSEASFPSQMDLTESRTQQSYHKKKHKVQSRKCESKGPIVKYHGPGTTNEMLSNSYKDLVGLDEDQLVQHLTKNKANKHQHSLPRGNNVSYGIYGDNDSLSDDCLYEPSVVQNAMTRKAQKLGYSRKSHSHGDVIGSEESGRRQQVALERSLTDENVNRVQHSVGNSSNLKAKRKVVKQLAMDTPDQERPDRVLHNVWNGSIAELDVTPSPIPTRRQKIKDKKKMRQQQVLETISINSTLKKKRSLRDSLKNIFFGKRHNASKVVELQNETAPAPPGFADSSPARSSAEVTPVNVDFTLTYDDEDGEPCSAV